MVGILPGTLLDVVRDDICQRWQVGPHFEELPRESLLDRCGLLRGPAVLDRLSHHFPYRLHNLNHVSMVRRVTKSIEPS